VFASGELFYCGEGGSHHLRLCFSGRPVEQIVEGIKRLAKALAACSAVGPADVFTVAMV
jgi:DNA-binding transcriptional MocR family regulator